jgi:hypothetical protein
MLIITEDATDAKDDVKEDAKDAKDDAKDAMRL